MGSSKILEEELKHFHNPQWTLRSVETLVN